VQRERAAGLVGAALAAALACSAEPAPSPVGAAAMPHAEPTSALARLVELSGPDPALTRALGQSRIVPSEPGAVTAAEALDATFARFAATADGPVELRAGRRTMPLASVRTLGARASALSIHDGVLRYPRALGDADVFWATRGDAIEQLVLLEQPRSAWALEWQLCLRDDLQRVRRGARPGLGFMDAMGQTRLFLPEPFALDATGRRRALRVEHTAAAGGCHRLRFELSLAGLSFPVLVDPALEVVTWIEKAFKPSDVSPEGRWWHGLAYDPVREVSVMFGGRQTLDSEPYFSDTWEWDGQVWKPITPQTSSPAPRAGFGMTYSALHGGVIVYGGAVKDANNSPVSIGETWQWDGKDWTQLAAGPNDPPKLFGPSLSYDSKRSVVVLYGGWNETTDNVEVYELSASGWTKPPNQSVSPGFLSFFPMTYHAQSSLTLVSGGLINQLFQAISDETWTWDGQVWSKLAVPGPSARYDVASAYDDTRQRTVLFGGTTEIVDTDETWEFSSGVWEKREAINRPFPMSASEMDYDKKRDRVVLFGGWSSVAEGDTWEYVHFGNTCTTTPECDGAPCVDGVCCSASTCGTCQACSATTGKCEAVQSKDDTDTCTGATTCDANGQCKRKNGQACAAAAECASGFCADGVCCNQACQGACEACGLGDSVGTCALVLGSAVHGSCPGSGPCGARCDGTSPDCSFAPEGTDCGTSCQSAQLSARNCDGAGSCVEATPTACAGHLACKSESACRDTCGQSADCAPGFACVAGACQDAVRTCVDEITAQEPGAQPMSCVPYRCENGSCRTGCTSALDCAPGNLCTQGGFCAPRPSSPGADDGGCGCRVTPRAPGRFALLALGVGLVLLRRRR
jgi:MYXO-CTERM domain-containing protein